VSSDQSAPEAADDPVLVRWEEEVERCAGLFDAARSSYMSALLGRAAHQIRSYRPRDGSEPPPVNMKTAARVTLTVEPAGDGHEVSVDDVLNDSDQELTAWFPRDGQQADAGEIDSLLGMTLADYVRIAADPTISEVTLPPAWEPPPGEPTTDSEQGYTVIGLMTDEEELTVAAVVAGDVETLGTDIPGANPRRWSKYFPDATNAQQAQWLAYEQHPGT